MSKERLVEECAQYFKSNQVLKSLLQQMISKYISLGRVGGKAIFNNPTDEEIEILEGLTGKNLHGKESISITTGSLQKIINQSRFQGVELRELFERYEGKVMITKKEFKRQQDQEIQAFFEKYIMKFQDADASKWLNKVYTTKCAPYASIVAKYRRNKVHVEKLIDDVMQALIKLPIYRNCYEYMPVFASYITKNPHYFDKGSEACTLLKHGIEYYCEVHGYTFVEKNNDDLYKVEHEQEIYYSVGILKDDISNTTTAYGIRGYIKQQEHEGILGYWKEQASHSLNLWTLSKLDRIECDNDCIYVVENPAVFNWLIQSNAHKYAVLCSNGQPKLATLILLDKITKSRFQIIYYAGDFDPEGLLIADRLKRRYEDKMRFWNMDVEHYLLAKSEEKLDEHRIKKMENIVDTELQRLAERIKYDKVAGYQERIVRYYEVE